MQTKLLSGKLERLANPTTLSFSKRYPFLLRPIIATKIVKRSVDNVVQGIRKIQPTPDIVLPYKVYEHQSPLKRKVSLYDDEMLKNKITNLRLGVRQLNGVIIKPGQYFSFWECLGMPTRLKGYKNGLMLEQGKPVKGPGGGLCQMTNLLFWMFLHVNFKIIERHHHSFDSFPDEGRTLPFGSGASAMFNYYDLIVRNDTESNFQLKLWLTDTKLKGQLLSDQANNERYHADQAEHTFIKYQDRYYRYNKIYREKPSGEREYIVENLAPVLYEVDEEKLLQDGITIKKF